MLIRYIQATPTVTNEQKFELGVPVRSEPAPIPAPGTAPNLDVISATGTTVKIKLHDSASGVKRGLPPGVAGASIFSFTGAQPSTNAEDYTFQGNTTRVVVDFAFDSALPAGTKVWLTACWYSARALSGPGCNPVSANLPGGSVSLAA